MSGMSTDAGRASSRRRGRRKRRGRSTMDAARCRWPSRPRRFERRSGSREAQRRLRRPGEVTESVRPGSYTPENSDPDCLAPWKSVFLYQPVVFRVHKRVYMLVDVHVWCFFHWGQCLQRRSVVGPHHGRPLASISIFISPLTPAGMRWLKPDIFPCVPATQSGRSS